MGIYCGRKILSVHQSLPFPFTHMLANEVLCGAVGIISLYIIFARIQTPKASFRSYSALTYDEEQADDYQGQRVVSVSGA
jgi:hypothetical protein